MTEIGIDTINKELLDDFKKDLGKIFEAANHHRCTKILSTFDYNDLIKLLNLGFSEEFLFLSLQGIGGVEMGPELSTFDWNTIEMRLQRLKNGR